MSKPEAPLIRPDKRTRSPHNSGYSLSPSFWRTFVRDNWEKRPACLQRLFEPAIMSADELFDAVANMPSRSKSDRLWVSKQSQPSSRNHYSFVSLDVFGPRYQDRSFADFFARISKGFGHRSIGINIHHLQRARPDLWFRFRDFAGGLSQLTGALPAQQWDIDTFFGTYHATPFGIHRDNASVFAIGVLGNRTYYAWPEEYFDVGDEALSTPDLARIGPHLRHATRMDVAPGEVVYWPSSHWHVVLSDGRPSAVVQLSAYFGASLSAIVGGLVRDLLRSELEAYDLHDVYRLHETSADLPHALLEAYDVLAEMMRGGRLADELERFWLGFRTADGFDAIPAADSKVHLEMADLIVVDPRYAIAWKRATNGELMIAANGLTFSVAADAAIIAILERLNSGTPVIVTHLIEQYGRDAAHAEAIMQVLASLQRVRAFQTLERQDAS